LSTPDVVDANWVTTVVVGFSTPVIAGLGAVIGRYIVGRSRASRDVLGSWAELTKVLQARDAVYQAREDSFHEREVVLQARIDTLTILVSKIESDRSQIQRRTVEVEIKLSRALAANELWEIYTRDLERELRKYLPADVRLPTFTHPRSSGDDPGGEGG
jgi:hypothetical protein